MFGALISGQAMTGRWVKIGFNYVVPLIVASIGYLAAGRAAAPAHDNQKTGHFVEIKGRH